MGLLEIDQQLLLNTDTISSVEKVLPLTIHVDARKVIGNVKIATNQITSLIGFTNTCKEIEGESREETLKRLETYGQAQHNELYLKIVNGLKRAMKSKGEFICISTSSENE